METIKRMWKKPWVRAVYGILLVFVGVDDYEWMPPKTVNIFWHYLGLVVSISFIFQGAVILIRIALPKVLTIQASQAKQTHSPNPGTEDRPAPDLR